MNHLPADGARAVERAVQDDADDGVPSVDREILGGADEVARGVVDEDVDVPEVLDGALDQLVHLLGVADVDLNGQRIEPGMAELSRSRFEVCRVPAADDDARAERTEALRNGETDAGAAAGDDGNATLEHLRTKHEAIRLSQVAGSRFADSRRLADGLPTADRDPRCYHTAGLSTLWTPPSRQRTASPARPSRACSRRCTKASTSGWWTRAAARRSSPTRSSS